MDTMNTCDRYASVDDGLYINGRRVVPDRCVIFGPRGPIRIEPKMMAVLICLARRAGSVVRHDELIEAAWGADGATSDLLSRAVGRLRRVLSERNGPTAIETVRGRGYCMVAEVSVSAPTYLGPRTLEKSRWRRLSPAAASGLSVAASVVVWLMACAL